MKKSFSILLNGLLACGTCYAQSKIITTGNNLVNPGDPKAADIVIGSDEGTRHDASIMWWSNVSASRISNNFDVFYLSVWNTLNANIGLSAIMGGSSFFQGKVGIGTTTPTSLLDVNGEIKGNAISTVNSLSIQKGGKNWQMAYDDVNHGFYIDEFGYARHLYIKNGGNVGIGTANPDAKLTVNGAIHTSEVRVDANVPVPDYVFEKDYKLMPLLDVEKYISANKHLPEIPSAQVIEKDGLSLSEMNMKLLKKVEELTLYLLEKEKRDRRQQKQINTLRNRLDKYLRQAARKHSK